jgi:hypothetical protein
MSTLGTIDDREERWAGNQFDLGVLGLLLHSAQGSVCFLVGNGSANDRDRPCCFQTIT